MTMMKKIFQRSKTYLNNWIDATLSARIVKRQRLNRLIRTHGRLQKFWLDRNYFDIPASPKEKLYFSQHGLESFVHHCGDDYRSAAKIESSIELQVPNSKPTERNGDVAIQLAVATTTTWTSADVLNLSLGSKTVEYRDLEPNRWHDLRVGLDSSEESPEFFDIQIKTSRPVVVTMPRVLAIGPQAHQPNRETATASSVRHVVICVLDSWSSLYLEKRHPFRHDRSVMPNVEKYFSRGLRAPNGYSSGEWTLPAISSLFTGVFAGKHKIVHPKNWSEFPLERKTLPEYFQNLGFHTLLGSCVSRVTPAFGHLRGIDRFLYHFPSYSEDTYHPAIWIDELTGHLESHYYSKTFSYFHFPDPHPIWDNPKESRYFSLGRSGSTQLNLKCLLRGKSSSSELRASCEQLYLLKLAEIDRALGTLFEYVEREFGNDALVIATSDHGLRMPYEAEYERNLPYLKDRRVQIPLFIRGGTIPPLKFEGPCSPNLDIPKILADHFELVWDEPMDGVDVTTNGRSRDVVVSESFYQGVYELAVRGFGHTLIQKFTVDDVQIRLTETRPHYIALFKTGETDYSDVNNLAAVSPNILQVLQDYSYRHIDKCKLM